MSQGGIARTTGTSRTRTDGSRSHTTEEDSSINTTAASIPPATLNKAVVGEKRKRRGEPKQTRMTWGSVAEQEEEVDVENRVRVHVPDDVEDRLEKGVNAVKRVEDRVLEHRLEGRGGAGTDSGKEADDPNGGDSFPRKFLNLIRQPTHYPLCVVHKEKEEVIVLDFDPVSHSMFEISCGIIFADQLITDFCSQLLQHFCRPPTDEVILQLEGGLDGRPTATIRSKAVITRLLWSKSSRSLEAPPMADPGLFRKQSIRVLS